jgi:hypothetical protein
MAANLLGFSTQVPAKIVYTTTGKSCIKKIGNINIIFQHARVPLIDDISNYNFSIIRFNMNGAGLNLPLFIPQIDTTQSNINQTVYSLGFFLTKTFTGTAGATFTFTGYQSEIIEWVTQVTAFLSTPPLASPLPNPPNSGNGQDLRSY